MSALFTFTPNNAPPGTPVVFTNISTSGTVFSWDFGDGVTVTSDIAPVTHSFANPGAFSVTLSDGVTSTTATVTVPGLSFNSSTLWIPLESQTDAQWSSISVKGTPAVFPLKFYDTGDYPLRTIKVWPIPSAANGVELWLWQPLSNFNLDDPIAFPPGYERALRFALAIELAPEFGKDLPPQVPIAARAAKAIIKRLNSSPQVMVTDRGIATGRTTMFNYLKGDTV